MNKHYSAGVGAGSGREARGARLGEAGDSVLGLFIHRSWKQYIIVTLIEAVSISHAGSQTWLVSSHGGEEAAF